MSTLVASGAVPQCQAPENRAFLSRTSSIGIWLSHLCAAVCNACALTGAFPSPLLTWHVCPRVDFRWKAFWRMVKSRSSPLYMRSVDGSFAHAHDSRAVGTRLASASRCWKWVGTESRQRSRASVELREARLPELRIDHCFHAYITFKTPVFLVCCKDLAVCGPFEAFISLE